MAEAPLPPSNLDYNSFRSWRKNNGLTNTQPTLSNSWKEYKNASVVSVSKKSPSRSPVRDPRKYGGWSSASLIGLPQDVTNIITRNMPISSVYGMTVASKQTGRMVASRRAELCDEPLTQEEILSGLESLILPIGVGFSELSGVTWLESNVLYVVDRNEKGVFFANITTPNMSKSYSKWKKPIRGFVESFIMNNGTKKGRKVFVHLAPHTLLSMYKRRGSCLRVPGYLEDRRIEVREVFVVMALFGIQHLRRIGIQGTIRSMIEGRIPITRENVPLANVEIVTPMLLDRIQMGLLILTWICLDKTLVGGENLMTFAGNINNNDINLRKLLIVCLTRLQQAYTML